MGIIETKVERKKEKEKPDEMVSSTPFPIRRERWALDQRRKKRREERVERSKEE